MLFPLLLLDEYAPRLESPSLEHYSESFLRLVAINESMDGIVLRIVNSQRLEYFSFIAVRRPRAVCDVRFTDVRFARSLTLNREKFDVKNERGIDANHRTGTPLAVGQIRWNEKLPFGADRHELKR